MAGGNLQADPLFIGLTRPAMIMGVSYMYFLINMMVCMCTFIQSSNFFYLLVLAPSIHGLGYFICLKEPRLIELAMVKLGKCMRCKNVRYHGFTNSYDTY